jgi:photosystem II stability/assembly factor-like uncharacterized protein
MITPSSGLTTNMESYTRNPTAKLSVSWNTVLLSGEWFRLDQSEFDTGAILTQEEYEQGINISESLSDIDSRVYSDESDYLIMLEGYAELLGDSYQYSIADLDVELDNSNNRFTPRENKNKLLNPGFEYNKENWNESLGTSVVSSIDENNVRTGIRSLHIQNPVASGSLIFSDLIPIYSSDGISNTPVLIPEYWSYSQYHTGSGVNNAIQLRAYDNNSNNYEFIEIKPAGETTKDWNRIFCDNTGINIIAGQARLYLSNNYGVTWTEKRPSGVDENRVWYALAISDDGSFIVAGDYGKRLYTSNNGGSTWTERKPAGDLDAYWKWAACDKDGTNIIVCTSHFASGGRIYTSNDSGVTWTEKRPAGDVSKIWSRVASNEDGSVLMAGVGAAGSGRLYISLDSGLTWAEPRPAGDIDKKWDGVHCNDSGKTMYASVMSGRIYKSTDYGTNWIELFPEGDSNHGWFVISCDYLGNEVIVGGYGGYMYTSSDGGNTWTQRFSTSLYSSCVDVSGDGSHYVLSQYDVGGGKCYISNKSAASDVTTGYLKGISTTISSTSGVWSRGSATLLVPSGSYYLRAIIAVSGGWSIFDDGQVEKSFDITAFDSTFVGDLILPKRAIKTEVGFNNYNVPKFTGLINKFVPSISKDTIQIYAYDVADRLKDIIVEDEYFENKRTDELIIQLASFAGIGVGQISVETGTNTIEFAYFQEGSVWTYMNQIAEAEGGRIFFDETGKLTFWNKDHYKNNPDVSYTFNFSRHITSLNYEISKEKVKNRIYVKAYPKKKLTDVNVYNDSNTSSISPGTTEEFFCQYNYKEETSVPALNVQVPVIGTDIIANTQEDGGGSNISTSISISSYYIFRESMRINLYNNNASTAYLTTFKIKGDPIVIARRIEVIEEDTNSQSIYDIQELQIENNFITTDDFANILAIQKLAELKDSRDFIKIEAVGVPYLQLGDRISVQRSFNGDYEDFHIVKNSWSLSDDFMQSLELEKKVII